LYIGPDDTQQSKPNQQNDTPQGFMVSCFPYPSTPLLETLRNSFSPLGARRRLLQVLDTGIRQDKVLLDEFLGQTTLSKRIVDPDIPLTNERIQIMIADPDRPSW
jgi:hypothetical protein